MTREEAKELLLNISAYDIDMQRGRAKQEALDMAIKALEQEHCEDAISRQAVLDLIADYDLSMGQVVRDIHALQSVSTEKTWRCKNCKYFEYDSVAKVNGMSLVIAHEICSKWGNGCKTREDGCCFLFEPKESEE